MNYIMKELKWSLYWLISISILLFFILFLGLCSCVSSEFSQYSLNNQRDAVFFGQYSANSRVFSSIGHDCSVAHVSALSTAQHFYQNSITDDLDYEIVGVQVENTERLNHMAAYVSLLTAAGFGLYDVEYRAHSSNNNLETFTPSLIVAGSFAVIGTMLEVYANTGDTCRVSIETEPLEPLSDNSSTNDSSNNEPNKNRTITRLYNEDINNTISDILAPLNLEPLEVE